MAKAFITDNEINWFISPPESPDLNMVENVWAALKRYISKENPRTQDGLTATVFRFWKVHLTKEQCNRYIDHIHRVIPVVIEKKGAHSGF